MFRQIKYAFLDIKTSKRISIIFFIQMAIVFLLINYSIGDIIKVNEGVKRLEKLKTRKAYVNSDGTSDGKIDALIADEKNSISKMKKLYNYIINNDKIEKYSSYQYTTRKSLNGKSIVQATTDKMFFELYDITVIEGRMFDEADFMKNLKIIPIVVGYDLKDKYQLGKVYSEIDPATNKEITYKVVGILKHNLSYPSLFEVGREINLNYTFFRPLNIGILNDFGSMDMAISSTVIFANDKTQLNAIENKSIELGLFSMNYKPIQERIDEYLGPFTKKMIYQIFIAGIVLMFAGISMSLNLTTMILKKMKEFSIHLVCGGTISSILQRILCQLLIILSLALVPTIILFEINISLLYTILTAFIIALLVMIIPYIKIRTTNIIQLVRRSE